jgi:hypothetical protein
MQLDGLSLTFKSKGLCNQFNLKPLHRFIAAPEMGCYHKTMKGKTYIKIMFIKVLKVYSLNLSCNASSRHHHRSGFGF